LIAAPRAYDEVFRSLHALGPVEEAAQGGFVVDDGASRVYVTRNDFARDEFEPADLDRLL
jgi:hypothetical protein